MATAPASDNRVAATADASPSSSTPKPQQQLTNRLYVGNLAPSVDEYALVQVFQRHGKLTKLDFMYHKTGPLKGKPRGYAFVEMQTKEDAQKAMIKLHDRLLRGRKLVVTPASSAPPDNAPLPTGTRGRRSEPAKQTTLSLLKSKQKPTSAAAQIAAMEAKLATMQSRKPIDEDWVPGQLQSPSLPGSASASREGSAGPSRWLSPVTGSREQEEERQEQGQMGEDEGRRAADQLESEMAEILGSVVSSEQSNKGGFNLDPAAAQPRAAARDPAPSTLKPPAGVGLPEKPAPLPPTGRAALPKKPSAL